VILKYLSWYFYQSRFLVLDAQGKSLAMKKIPDKAYFNMFKNIEINSIHALHFIPMLHSVLK
jgi:hypothetical protein